MVGMMLLMMVTLGMATATLTTRRGEGITMLSPEALFFFTSLGVIMEPSWAV